MHTLNTKSRLATAHPAWAEKMKPEARYGES